MFGIADYHTLIRSIAVEYMKSHPEQFIESNTENSWIEYLNNMSRQGPWSDALIIQSTADSLRVRICLIESHSNFAHTTTIDPVTCQTETRLSIGHIDEFHYVSTVPAVPNTEKMFCDNSLSTDLAFGAYKTEKAVNTQSGELRKQQTCVNFQENCNTYVQQLTRQGRSVVKNKCNIEAKLNSIIEDIRKKSRQYI